MRQKKEKYQKATVKKNLKLLSTEEMKNKSEILKEFDENYTHKFGLLKKTNTLIKLERWGHAYDTILEAVKIVKEDKITERIAKEERERRIRESLGIPLDIEINYEKLNAEPLTEKLLQKLDIDIPIERIQVLLAKLSLEDPKFQNKNTYLNEQILELYEVVSLITKNQKKYLKKLKKTKDDIESLDPNNKSRPESERRSYLTPRRELEFVDRMCPNILKDGKIILTNRKMHRQIVQVSTQRY